MIALNELGIELTTTRAASPEGTNSYRTGTERPEGSAEQMYCYASLAICLYIWQKTTDATGDEDDIYFSTTRVSVYYYGPLEGRKCAMIL